MTLLHPLPPQAEDLPSPGRFTYPFCYQPHPLCLLAATEVRTWLRTQQQWQAELAMGKMMGVLVVRQADGRRCFLAAFSGTLGGQTLHPYFVPPVFDTMAPGKHFAVEQDCISAINRQIAALQKELVDLTALQQQADRETDQARQRMKKAKARRDHLRATLDETALAACQEQLVRESQFLKAELRRVRQHWRQTLDEAEAPNRQIRQQVAQLEQERKSRSQALQDWLFRQYVFLNAQGGQKSLPQIFEGAYPPGGAGDCCAPKLLQTCYLRGLTPLCMAEFWVGRPPRGEIRTDGHFYPACNSKCRPILQFMLQGLAVDPNPLAVVHDELEQQLHEVYRGPDFVVVSKPAGLLSVPGKDRLPSVYDIMRRRYPQAQGPMMVHRLDMDTSGLLVVALTDEAYHRLQQLFADRLVTKTYLALLERPMQPGRQGTIDLPLTLDPDHRPCRKVDEQHGQPALTHYRVLDNVDSHALVQLTPHTGRTHQLRVHCAHHRGLDNPIVGDRLYGTPAGKLMLHAARLCFDSYAFEDNLQSFLTKRFAKIISLQ